MKSLLWISTLLGLAAAIPQRGVGGCGCREVICPNQGPDHCACINAAADDCGRYQRGDCPAAPRCVENGRPTNPYNQNGGRPPNTIYSTMPITYTVTTTLPGFYTPRPVTSYSTIVSMVTITLNQPPPGFNPKNPGWSTPQTIWQTTTINGTPPWAVPQPNPSTRPNTPPPPAPPRPTNTRPPSPPSSPNTYTQPWSVPPKPPPAYITTTTATRPPAWSPTSQAGPTWTPINSPIPNSAPASPAAPPPPVSAPAPVPAPSPVASAPNPLDTGMAAPPSTGAPQKCGPGAAACPDGTYCDPQPLCSIGEDCAGVCLPTFNSKQKLTNFNSKFAWQQPWDVRRTLWQDLLNNGTFSIYGFDGMSL